MLLWSSLSFIDVFYFFLILVQVIKFRFSPFISLLTSSIVIGLLSGLDGEIIINNIQQGMGSTLGYIAVIVGLGAMFGAILESTGGAFKNSSNTKDGRTGMLFFRNQ